MKNEEESNKMRTSKMKSSRIDNRKPSSKSSDKEHANVNNINPKIDSFILNGDHIENFEQKCLLSYNNIQQGSPSLNEYPL